MLSNRREVVMGGMLHNTVSMDGAFDQSANSAQLLTASAASQMKCH